MSKIEERVCKKITERAETGLKKYGTTVERDDLTPQQWLVHAQEEAMDLAVYLERILSGDFVIIPRETAKQLLTISAEPHHRQVLEDALGQQ